MHQSLQGATFHVEHVVPLSLGGGTELTNLALACPACNLKKADRIEAIDPLTGQTVRLFNPRVDAWLAHFRWEEFEIVPLSPSARATSALLDLNRDRRLRIRRAESTFGLLPPVTC
ncbi:MAG: HNH endonuclease [Planctomycetaceae bacterium]|nr:HNH endonuclease [Planctomycetaceae bacterium]